MQTLMTLSLCLLFLLPFLVRSDAGHCAVLDTDSVDISNSYGARGAPDGHNSSWYPCYEELCWCFGHVANCSGNFGNLTYIPQLPDNVTSLIFNYNDVTEIQNYAFFLNVTSITDLELRQNGLIFIVSNAFCLLTKLESLCLSDNNLNNSAIPAIFNITTLRYLDVTNNNLGPLSDDMFFNLHLPHLVTLKLKCNHVGYSGNLNLSVFVPFGNLNYLSLSSNRITEIVPDRMDSLVTLDLGINGLYKFPDTCSSNETSYFPCLRFFFLNSNYIWSVPRDVCLPTLQVLYLNENQFMYLEEEYLNLYMFPNLTQIYLESMSSAILTIKENAFRSKTLQLVSLMSNQLVFETDNIQPKCFAGAPNLNQLQLSYNLFDRLTDTKWDLLFGNLTNLQNLYIEHAYVGEISLILSKLTSLQRLMLGKNNVAMIPEGMFSAQPNLTFLQLDNNRISAIPQSTFSQSTRQRLSHLDLSGNPFTCSCDVMWFRDWLVTDPGLFQPSWSTYECDNLPGTNLTSFYMSEQACLMSRETAGFITVSVSLLISSVTVLTLLYRYRWHLRLVLYEAFVGSGDARRWRLQRQDFLYDLFVSYAAQDLPWMRAHLMPQLEEALGLRLCLHDRDFIPGHPIVSNIEESVQSSKKVLMLFSSHFARSEWCQFELTLCLSHVMEHEDALLVVLLHDVPTHDLTSAMMAVLRTTTYIEWAQHPDAVASFWGRMRMALHEILPPRQQHRPRDA